MKGLMRRNSAERLVASTIWTGAERMRRFLDIVSMINPFFIIYKCGMLFYCCTDCSGDMVLSFLLFFVLSCIRKCDLRVKLALAANAVPERAFP